MADNLAAIFCYMRGNCTLANYQWVLQTLNISEDNVENDHFRTVCRQCSCDINLPTKVIVGVRHNVCYMARDTVYYEGCAFLDKLIQT